MPRERELLTRSCLRVAGQWAVWLGHNLDRLDCTDPQERLLRDTALCVMHNVLNCARRLRGNPGWDMSGTLRDDTVNLHSEMLAVRETYLKNRPPLERQQAGLANMYELMDGIVNQQVRLAREVQEMRESGSLSVEVTTDKRTAKIIEALH